MSKTRPARRKLAIKRKCIRNDPFDAESVIFPSLFLSVVLADGWKSSKRSSSGYHGVTEDHEQSTNDAQVTQEEIEVENEAVTEPLNDDNAEKSADSKFGVFLRDNGTGAGKHSLKIPEVIRAVHWHMQTELGMTHDDVDEQEHM